jgi:hypothetical protein
MNLDKDRAEGSGRQDAWVSHALSLGTNIVAGMGLFTFLGYSIDKYRGGGILWTLAGAGLGLIYMAYEFWKVIRLLNSKPDDGKDNGVNDKRAGKS